MQAQDADLIFDEEEETSHMANINQSGNNNYAEQTQNNHANTATALQSGNGNDAWQTQNAWKSSAYVEQSGSNNDATQIQYNSLNYATIVQSSDGNIAEQLQTSGVKRSGVAEYDALNLGEIYQWGGNGNEAYQTQTTPGGDIDMNYAGIWQNGSNNYAEQTQWDGFNSSIVSQTGSSHTAIVTQSQSVVE
jgi:hypothetical protein